MKVLGKILFLSLIIFGLLPSAMAQPLSPAQVAALVNQNIKPILIRNHVPGAVVVLYNHGRPQAFYYGTAVRYTNKHVGPDTTFELGSITKVFTGILLAYVSYKGQINMNAPAIVYLRNGPAANRAFNHITLVGLASHATGLGQMPANSIKNRYQLMQSLVRWRPPYQPNTWWRYSNTGFGLLGYALEDTTKQSYASLIHNYIALPLKMSDTGMVGKSCQHCAQGYSWNGQPVTTTKTLLVIPAAGSVRASGSDMIKFLGAALHLPNTPPDLAAAIRLSQMPYFRTPYGEQGLGWEIHNFSQLYSNGYIQARYRTLTLHSSAGFPVYPAPLPGTILYDKTGSVAGFRAYIAAVPTTQTGIVVLVNSAMPRTQLVLAARKVLYQMVKA